MSITRCCLNCGNEFKTSPSQAKRGGKYCSTDCKKKHQRGENSPKFSKTEVKCSNPECNETIFLPPSLINRNNGKNYCSKKCHYNNAKGINDGGRPKTLIEQVCQNPKCRKKFFAYPTQIKKNGGKYCSRQCMGVMSTGSNNSRYSRIKTRCSMCGEQVEIKKCLLDKHNNHFCNRECKNTYEVGENTSSWKGGKAKRICPICRKEFYAVNADIARGKAKYCSVECQYKGSQNRVECTCPWCGKIFNLPESATKNTKNNFCSRECMNAYSIGENASNWQGGLSFIPYPLGFRNSLKKMIRHRDYYICQACGKKEGENGRKLAIHHIDYDKNNLNLENLISLCSSCHTKTNFNRDQWQQFFTEKS